GALASALAMDKDLAKRLFRAAGVPVPAWFMAPVAPEDVTTALGWPVIVKPSKMGSSVGMTLVRNAEGLDAAVLVARAYDAEVMAEQFIPGRELTVGVLGDVPLPVGEIIPKHELFDYECKYMPGQSEEVFPATLDTTRARHLLQVTLFVSPGFLATFGFVPLTALARPWTFLTYMFLHGNFLHLAFNLLALFVFGPQVEERMGGGTFLRYYLLCGLGGAALSFVLMQFRPVTLVVGASAAVYGVLLAFAWAWPDQPINVFLLPTPIPAKWLVTVYVAVALLLALRPASAGVAPLAHLGGFATGFLYLKIGDWQLGRAERNLRRRSEPSVLVHPGRAARASAAPKPPRRVERDPAQAEIDRVLDKISARGIDSLTPAERRFLAEMSRKMRDHT